MHLPDGFLDTKTAVLSAGAAAVGLGLAVRRVKSVLEPRQTPLLGLAAAFVFAAQMLNFPIVGGTSGHLLGGVLVSVLLGPAPAVLVLTCVLIVQCLLFADGGVLALGANVFNIAVVNVVGGSFVFSALKRLVPMESSRRIVFAAAFAAWAGMVLAAVTCAGQLALSGTVAWRAVFPAMTGIHMLVGLGEALATGIITAAVLKHRPLLVAGSEPSRQLGTVPAWGYGLLLSAGMAIFVAPHACSWPDSLAAVARKLGFAGQGNASMLQTPFADYQLPFLNSPGTATAIAGTLGTLIAFVTAYTLSRLLVPALGLPKKDAPSRS